jgi:hypothetical protein
MLSSALRMPAYIADTLTQMSAQSPTHTTHNMQLYCTITYCTYLLPTVEKPLRLLLPLVITPPALLPIALVPLALVPLALVPLAALVPLDSTLLPGVRSCFLAVTVTSPLVSNSCACTQQQCNQVAV